LKNCNKSSLRSAYPWYSLISNCGASKTKVPPPGLKKDKSVELTRAVKIAIFDTLAESGGELKDGRSALQRHGASVYEDLQWTLNLRTAVHTIMVWHIATSLCESHLAVKLGGSKKSFKSYKVAIHLSRYCAYLVAFYPELLTLNSNLVKFIFWKIIDETSDFFGREHNLQKKCNKMMSCSDGGEKIIHLGLKLGRYLMEIPNDDDRWKIMADFWSELILSLARGGSTRVHIKKLLHGSEFITHLWALLYHAGISDSTSEEYQP
jgi:Protein of unknown function, DUF594